MKHWAIAFALTQLLELPVYVAFALRDKRPFARVAIAFFASTITHPVVWFVLPSLWKRVLPAVVYYPGATTLSLRFVCLAVAYFAFRESFAVVVEALYLRSVQAQRPFFWSLMANGLSAATGVVLTLTTGWP